MRFLCTDNMIIYIATPKKFKTTYFKEHFINKSHCTIFIQNHKLKTALNSF